MPNLSRAPCFFSIVGNGRLVSCDGQLSFWHWKIQMEPSPFLLPKFSASSTLSWQKRHVTDSLIFSCSLWPATIAWPYNFCHASVLSRSVRGSSTVIFDRLALHVMLTKKPTNRIWCLAARSTPLAIAPGRSKSLCHFLLILQPNQS